VGVNRYYADEIDETWADTRFVLAAGYDSLLAVLRRCVKGLEDARFPLAYWGRALIVKDIDAALAAAREFTEAKP
jgi:hypothetical protein